MTPNEAASIPVLRRGMRTPLVTKLKSILRSQGAWTGSDSPDFGPRLEAAVRYFQGTHLGPNGKFLVGDGEVGPSTWWALYNPSGEAQRSLIVAPAMKVRAPGHVPKFDHRYGKLSQPRQNFLRVLFEQHAAGVREIPDGSNQGDGVDKFISGYGAVYWCALFLSWSWKEGNGDWPRGSREAGVMNWWRKAVAGGYARTKKSGYVPVPGDLAVWQFARGAGHISGVVASDLTSERKFNTIGGNEGNRVKLGLRVTTEEPQLIGWIDLVGDGPESKNLFVPGLLPAGDTSKLNLTASR